MDYEKKYNEAFEKARRLYEGKDKAPEEPILEYLFPELRESEDERIRKAIIELLKEVEEDETYTGRQHIPDMLLYLEKQKVLTEHKEGIYYYHRDGTFTFISHPAVENPHNFTVPRPNEKPVDYDHEMWKNCEANFEGGKKEVIDHPEKYGLQKEQKPAEEINDQRQIYFMIEDGRRCGVIEGRKQVIDNPEMYGLQKPAEWSEEDEKRLNAVVELLENTSAIHPNYSRRKLIIWLKSLRPSWKPSEQDELMKLKYAGTSTKLD